MPMSINYTVDHTESEKIAERMKSAVHRLHALAPLCGAASQVKEYNSDRRKNLLAKYVVPSLKAGESVAAAEYIARSNEAFQKELEVVAKQFESAIATLREWDAEYASWESARSLLSFSKATLEHVE